ncbi:hypothetical protein B0H13DRAFT_1965401 [Mycena leptocephala]|nr:hypothetical protein B0H13DRAFT_1965401 [Mycena leptocephala]
MSWKPLDPPFELSEPKFSSQNQRRPRARSSPPAMNSPPSLMASTGALDYFNSRSWCSCAITDISSLACTATHGSIAASLITDAFLSLNKLSDSVEATDANEGWAAVVGKGGKGFSVEGGSGKPGGGDDRNHGRQRGGGRGNRRGGQGDRGRGEEEEDMFFREVRRSIINVAMFATPPKDVPDRFNSAQEIASRLSSNSTIDRLSRNAYDPFEDDEGMDADTRRVLFHGTRHSTLPSFTSLGIQPPPRRNTLSRGPAFYTTTDARIAYLHAILHHPASHPFPPSDVVIAPHLVPQSDQTVYIPRYTFIGTGTQPTQVAAATQAAWAYFAASVDEILIEERVAEAAEEQGGKAPASDS